MCDAQKHKHAKVKSSTRAKRIHHPHYRHRRRHHHSFEMGENWILCLALYDESGMAPQIKANKHFFNLKISFPFGLFHPACAPQLASQFSIHIASLECTSTAVAANVAVSSADFFIIDFNNSSKKYGSVFVRSDLLHLTIESTS